ncbi:MAG: haloacid dehalogenase-like hydrolase [Bacteroidales bacterium]|nr:haloacid dehalogenase-like hydrolase [Bacteroidales bacterium]
MKMLDIVKRPAAFLLLTAIPAMLSCGENSHRLPKDNWEPSVYAGLDGMISRCGKYSDGYDPECRPYAVFDFDNTTVINDISMTLMIYMVENMKFAFSPDEAFGAFTGGLQDIDTVMTGFACSARDFAEDLCHDYRAIRGRMDGGAAMEDVHSMPEYLDFRAKLWGLNEGIENTYDYGTWCLWMPSLLSGMTYGQIQDLTRESASYWLAWGKIWTEKWNSPDGIVSASVMKGLALPKESVNLYRTLADNGIDVYICSASLEAIVETMACDPAFGLGLDPEHVFGIRLADGDMPGGGFDKDYDQTFLGGKTKCIRRFIAPSHCGRGPVLVAGDSNGDYDMLTAFPDMKVGLIINCQRSGGIAELGRIALEQGDDESQRYLLQGRDLSLPGYVKASESR